MSLSDAPNEGSAAEAAADAGGVRGSLRAIALAEMARRRRALGEMTSEQERAIEELLLATAERISGPILEKARELYLRGEVERARDWASVFG
jgi:hypothetical protein